MSEELTKRMFNTLKCPVGAVGLWVTLAESIQSICRATHRPTGCFWATHLCFPAAFVAISLQDAASLISID